MAPSEKEKQKMYPDNHFSKYIKPFFYLGDGFYKTNDNEYGVILSITPRTRMGVQTAETMLEILEKVPHGILLSVSLLGIKNIHQLIEYWKKIHSAYDDPLALEAVESLARFFINKTNENITKDIKVKLKDNVCLFSMKSNSLTELQRAVADTTDILTSNVFSPRRLDGKTLKPILYELFNSNHDLANIPEYDEGMFLNKQCIASDTLIKQKHDHIEIDGKCWIGLSPAAFPEETHIVDLSQRLGMYLGEGVNTNQFNDTFIITLNLTRESEKYINSVKTALSVMHGQRQGELCTLFNEKRNEAKSITNEINSGTPLFRVDMNIFVSGNTLSEAKANATTIESFWKKGGLDKGGFILGRLNYIHMPAFIASLPLCVDVEYFEKTKKYTLAFSKHVAHFFPIEADMQGNEPNIILMSRRGRIAGIDIYESETNKNALVIAESGAGKSMFVNNLSFCSLMRGDKVFIIDIGRSYEKLCKTFNGQFIELVPERPISFNPFTNIKTEKDLFFELDFLSSFIYTLGASRNKSKSDEDAKFIEQHIQTAIKVTFSKSTESNPMSITDIRDYLAKESDRRLKDFAVQVGSFCRGGVFGDFFDGPNEIDFGKDMVVLEIDGIENLSADIRDAVISVFIYKVSQFIYIENIDYRKTNLIIDEAHMFIGKENRKMDRFVQQAYKRFRKHNGAIMLIIQGFGDVYDKNNPDLARLGTSIVDNSKWIFFFQQKVSSIDILANSDPFKSLGELNVDILRSLKSKKGQYSEIAVYHDGSMTPFRLVLNKFFYWLLTTDPDDKKKINDLMDMHGYSLVRAIKELAGVQ